MKEEYEDWMGDMQNVLRNLPLYGQYLRCPMPHYCTPQHFQRSADHVCMSVLACCSWVHVAPRVAQM